jgi:hypothetical protein
MHKSFPPLESTLHLLEFHISFFQMAAYLRYMLDLPKVPRRGSEEPGLFALMDCIIRHPSLNYNLTSSLSRFHLLMRCHVF